MRVEFEDLFQDSFVFKNIGWEKFYAETYRIQYKKNNELKRRFIKKLINILSNFISIFRDNKPNIIIWGDKFTRIVDEQSNNYNFFLLTNSMKIARSIKWKKGCYPVLIYNWQRKIDKSYYSERMKYAEKSINMIQSYLRKKRISVVILGNDKLFIERGIKIAAEALNIPVIILQHGIYGVDSFTKTRAADTAKHFWVWSEYVKDLYIKCYSRTDIDIQIVGFPLKIYKTRKPSTPSILFLGNQYFNYNEVEGNNYLKIANLVNDICKEEGWRFRYRPHPSEIIDDRYPLFEISHGFSLQDDVNNSCVVVGDVSSSMIESAIIGRPVVQIIWSERSRNVEKDPMYSFTIKCSDDRLSIKNAMLKAMGVDVESNIIDDYYMHIDEDFTNNINKLINSYINMED